MAAAVIREIHRNGRQEPALHDWATPPNYRKRQLERKKAE